MNVLTEAGELIYILLAFADPILSEATLMFESPCILSFLALDIFFSFCFSRILSKFDSLFTSFSLPFKRYEIIALASVFASFPPKLSTFEALPNRLFVIAAVPIPKRSF